MFFIIEELRDFFVLNIFLTPAAISSLTHGMLFDLFEPTDGV